MSIHEKILVCDDKIIHTCRSIAMPFARFAIFVIYFWFGALKVFGESPANPLVSELLTNTLPWITFDSFIFAFGILEMLIAILFIIPHLERLAVFVLLLHLITTIMPLILLPEIAWSGAFTPTLEGQYIIKNILTLALVVNILAHLRSDKELVTN